MSKTLDKLEKRERSPFGWKLDGNGISKVSYKEDKDGKMKEELKLVCKDQIKPIRRIRPYKDKYLTRHTLVELSSSRGAIRVDEGVLKSGNLIDSLAAKELPVHNKNQGELSVFFSDYLHEIEIPVTYSVDSLGWLDDDKTFICNDSQFDLLIDCDKVSGFTQKGTIEGWREYIKPAYQYPMAKIIMGAFAAAPLMHLLGKRTFVLHVWEKSKSAKTAACLAGLSLWGDPLRIKCSLNSTLNAIQGVMAIYKNLPILFDELGSLSNPDIMKNFAYIAGNESGKQRANKDGSARSVASWKTIIVTTGEQPMSTYNIAAGQLNRLIEISDKVFDDPTIGIQYHTTNDHYGLVGEMIVAYALKNREEMLDLFNVFFKQIDGNGKSEANVNSAAMILLGCYLFDKIGMGIEVPDVNDLAEILLEKLPDEASMEDAPRMYQTLLNEFHRKMESFMQFDSTGQAGANFNAREWLGVSDSEYIWFNSNYFDKLCKEHSFDPGKCKKELAERGWIEMYKNRYQTPKSINGVQASYIKVRKDKG